MTQSRAAPEMLLRPQPRPRYGQVPPARERIPRRRAKAILAGAQGRPGWLFRVPAGARSSVLTPVRGKRSGRGWRILVEGTGAARNHNCGNSMLEDQLLLIVGFQHQRVLVKTLD